MRSKPLLLSCLLSTQLAAYAVAADDKPGEAEQTPAAATANARLASEEAVEAVERLVATEDRREAKAIQQEIAQLGSVAIAPLRQQTRKSEDDTARLRCYEVFTAHFASEAAEFIVRGLEDDRIQVRYHCAWHCGKSKLYRSHHSLRGLMGDPEQPEHVRNAATMSLAMLGEPDVIVQLVRMMDGKGFMSRHMGNLGAAALSGKDLNDFNGYDYTEGALVFGGAEAMLMHPYPPTVHDRLAARHKAIADYLRWLEKEKPELFKHLYSPW